MNDTIKSILAIAGFLTVFIALGVTLGLATERSRRRTLRAWASAQGGTFEPGAFLNGTSVPEAAAFDEGRGSRVTYRHVIRIAKPEASYVLARYTELSSGGIKSDDSAPFSCVLCFVSLPGVKLPEVYVSSTSSPPSWLDKLLGESERPTPLQIPDAAPGFVKAFEALPMSEMCKVYEVTEGPEGRVVTQLTPATVVTPDALARALPWNAQTLLLAKSDLITSFEVRGDVVRIQSVGRSDDPFAEVFEVARGLAEAWRDAARW